MKQFSGQLTLSKAIALLLNIESEQELILLVTHDGDIKRKAWHNGYAMGADEKGNLVWGGGYRLRTPSAAAQSAV